MSRRHVRTKPAIKHTIAEREHLRRVKRKSGPSGLRRAKRRREMFPIEACGCRITSDGNRYCAEHGGK